MFTSYLAVEGHEDSETGQMGGATCGVSFICLHQDTALCRPVAALLCAFPVDAEDLFDTRFHLKREQARRVLPREGQLSECWSTLVGFKEVTHRLGEIR